MYDMSALYQAQSVQDAIRLRLEHPEAQIIAGGTDVLVQMREGKRAGKALISIQGCGEMRGVTLDEEAEDRPSGGKLLSSMQRSGPKAAIAAST